LRADVLWAFAPAAPPHLWGDEGLLYAAPTPHHQPTPHPGRVAHCNTAPASRPRARLWALGSGLWALGSGLWALGSGLWALGSGLWALGSGLWALGSGLWADHAPPRPVGKPSCALRRSRRWSSAADRDRRVADPCNRRPATCPLAQTLRRSRLTAAGRDSSYEGVDGEVGI